MNIKQIIIMRTDLNMRKGKMIAQGAHASMKVFLDRMQFNKEKINSYEYDLKLTNGMHIWIENNFTKIVFGINSLEKLMRLKEKADEVKIPNALIKDNGLTEFKEKCPECSGYGKFSSLMTSPTALFTYYECLKCKGTGKINKPTITCLAIGPDESEKIDKITGDLQLL